MKCPLCSKEYSTEEGLKQHMRNMHPSIDRDEGVNEFLARCIYMNTNRDGDIRKTIQKEIKKLRRRISE